MPCVCDLQQDCNSNPQNAPRLRRIVGHPVLLRLVLEYSLAMVDCRHQPYQGVFARQGLHRQSPVLKSWTQTIAQPQLAQFRWFVHLQGCVVWDFT